MRTRMRRGGPLAEKRQKTLFIFDVIKLCFGFEKQSSLINLTSSNTDVMISQLIFRIQNLTF